MIIVGKTVESYRMALESEISRWNGFVRALRKEDREAFEELMDSCRNNAMAAGNATNPIIFEPMVMSILLGQQKRLRKIEQELKVFEKTEQASSIDQANKKPQL
jgi:hypothetical protein